MHGGACPCQVEGSHVTFFVLLHFTSKIICIFAGSTVNIVIGREILYPKLFKSKSNEQGS